MSKVTMSINDKKAAFTPMKVNLEFTIENQEQLNDIRAEIKDGSLEDFEAEYSDFVENIVKKLGDI